jgi:hypothetical protein
MKYNLIRNGNLYSITSIGTGNKELTWTDLIKLQNNNTTSSGVSMSASDIMYLEADLGERIKVDGIYLYMDVTAVSGTVLGNLDFYYKNSSGDGYSSAGKGSGATYYYATIPGYSAPRIVLTTLSGVVGEIYEFQIYNDDYLVSFGDDGTQTTEYLEDTPVGSEGEASEIEIYNNANVGTTPVDAYVAIDYSGTNADDYIKISDSETGVYYSLEDGVVMKDNLPSSTYTWDMGTHSDTESSVNGVGLEEPEASDLYMFGDLPCTETDCFKGLNVSSNGWDFDRTNNRMFALFSDYWLKLYQYNYRDDEWVFIGKIDPSGDPHSDKHEIDSHIQYASMGYLNDKIYVCVDRSGKFGYYDLNGPINNWTTLSGIPIPSLSVDPSPPISWSEKVSIVSDQEEYIYAITFTKSDNNIPAAHAYFGRYSTVSGSVAGWETLDNNYFNNGYTGDTYADSMRQHLSYDYDRGCVYLTNGQGQGQGTPTFSYDEHIQRYIVSTDTWDLVYVDLDHYFTAAERKDLTAHYLDDYIYILGAEMADGIGTQYFARYNILTDEMEIVDIDFNVYVSTGESNYIMPIKQPYNDTEFGASVYFLPGSVFGGSVYTYDNLYGYNAKEFTGTYITPVIRLVDKYKASYFLTDTTTASGFTNVSYNGQVFDGTIRVRSSDTAPMSLNEIYWPYKSSFHVYINKISVYTSDVVTQWADVDIGHSDRSMLSVAIDRRTRYIAVSWGGDSPTISYGLDVLDNDGNTYNDLTDDTGAYSFSKMEFDKEGGLWCYGGASSLGFALYHFDSSLTTVYESAVSVDFVEDFAVDLDGEGVWYIDNITDSLVHLDALGNESSLESVSLTAPMFLCGTSDNGVWVFDLDSVVYAKRYDSSGNLIRTINLGGDVDQVCVDNDDGFWFLRDNIVYHRNSDGVQISRTSLTKVSSIYSGHDGCAVWSAADDTVKYIDATEGSVTRTFSSGYDTKTPVFISHNYEDHLELQTSLLPVSYDPAWGTGGSVSWIEVQKDGHFLWKHIYHQIEFTLRSLSSEHIPYVSRVTMAPTLKLTDLQPKTSQSVYVKTDIPYGATIDGYETKLRVWWSVLL